MSLLSGLLTAAKRIVELNKDSPEHTPRTRSDLAAINAELEKLIETVLKIEEYVALAVDTPAPQSASNAKQIWETFPAGACADATKLDPLVKASELLRSLYKGGFDITKLHKFGAPDFQIAKTLGDGFSRFSAPLRAVRGARNGSNDKEKSILLTCAPECVEFLQLLERKDIARIRRLMVSLAGKFEGIKFEWVRRHTPETKLLAVLDINPRRFAFLRGQWLEAYVYDIMADHFSRNDFPFELYTGISYRSPSDELRLEGEFDLVGQVGKKVFCVECKSGMLLDSPAAIQKLVEKTTLLRRAVASMFGVADFQFYLVFDPTLNPVEQITKLLQGTEIKPLQPNEVRAEVRGNLLR